MSDRNSGNFVETVRISIIIVILAILVAISLSPNTTDQSLEDAARKYMTETYPDVPAEEVHISRAPAVGGYYYSIMFDHEVPGQPRERTLYCTRNTSECATVAYFAWPCDRKNERVYHSTRKLERLYADGYR